MGSGPARDVAENKVCANRPATRTTVRPAAKLAAMEDQASRAATGSVEKQRSERALLSSSTAVTRRLGGGVIALRR
jgi:hypothetical protein